MKTLLLLPARLREISDYGKARAPTEACGILLPEDCPNRGAWVWELPNRTLEPSKFMIWAADVNLTLQAWFDANPDRWNDLALWHTHASVVGPSEEDMNNRIDDIGNLVVTLGPPVRATWY